MIGQWRGAHGGQHRQELMDIAEETGAAARDVLGRASDVVVDVSKAMAAPLTVGDRRHVGRELRRLIGDVLEHARGASAGPVTRLSVSASTTADSSIVIRLEAATAWRELRLPVACAAPIDAPILAQIERYGFIRLAPLPVAA